LIAEVEEEDEQPQPAGPPPNIPAAEQAPAPQEEVRALLLQCLPQRVRIDD